MPSIWDPTSGETYSYSGLEGKSQEEILEELRRRRMATHAEPGETPWDDVEPPRPLDQIPAEMSPQAPTPDRRPPIVRGIQSVGDKLLGGLKDVGEKIDIPVPGAREAAEAAVQTPDIALPGGPNIPGLVKGAADAYGAVKEAVPAAVEEFGSDKIRDAILADESLTDEERALELYQHEDPGLVDRASRAVFAGAETTQRPDIQEQLLEDRVKNAGDVAEIPTIVDAAALAMAPFSMIPSTTSRLMLWGGRTARAVDAVDAAMGVRDVAEGRPVQGAIRLIGGGVGAALPGPEFIDEVVDVSKIADEVPSVHDVTTRMELEGKGASEGLSDGELDQLQALDAAQEARETVQPMNVEPVGGERVWHMTKEENIPGIEGQGFEARFNRPSVGGGGPGIGAGRQLEPGGVSFGRGADPFDEYVEDFGPSGVTFDATVTPRKALDMEQRMALSEIEEHMKTWNLNEEDYAANLDSVLEGFDDAAEQGIPASHVPDIFFRKILGDPNSQLSGMELRQALMDKGYDALSYQDELQALDPGIISNVSRRGAPEQALDDVYTQERTANISRLQAELDELEEVVIDPNELGTARDRMAAGQEFQAKQAELQSEMAQLEDYTSNQARANRMQELMNRPVTPEEAQELAALRGEHEAARAARVEGPMDEATQQVDEIGAVEDNIAAEAMAAEEAALKQDLARQAGEIEQARTLEAGKPLSFRDYVATKYPDGLPKKGRSRIGKEYRLWKERGYIEDIPPTEISGGKPPKKKPPLKKPGNMTPFGRSTRLSINGVKKLMPEAGDMLNAVRNTRERGMAASIHDVKQITKRVRDEGLDEDAIIAYLDGDDVQLELPDLKAAMEIRRGTRQIDRMAKTLGIYEKGRAAYFPHYVVTKGKGAGGFGPFRKEGKVPFAGHLEKARKTDANWIRDLDVLENYYTESWNKIAAAEHMGLKNEKFNKIVSSYQKLDPANKKYFDDAVTAIVKRPPMSSELGSKVRYWTAIMDLPLAAIYQVGQSSATAAVGGVGRSAKQFGRLMFDSKYRGQMSAAADRAGATLPDVAMEILGNLHGGSSMMWGVPTMDKAMRVHAYAVGEAMLSAAQAGDEGAAKALQDILGFAVDPKVLDGPTVGKALSDYTQFRTGAAEKPLWATTSEWGKFAYQYKHFAWHWGNMVGDLIKKKQGGALIKLALAGGVAGEVVGDIRAVLKGYDPFLDAELQEEASENPMAFLSALVTRSRRYPLTHPIHRALQNFGMVGGFGFFAEAMLDPITRGGRGVEEVGNIFPAARRPADLAAGAFAAGASGEIDPITRKLPGFIPGGMGYSGWSKLLKKSHGLTGGRQGGSGNLMGGRR